MAWAMASIPSSLLTCRGSKDSSLQTSNFRSRVPSLLPPFWPWEKVKVGPLSVSPMGFGTWAWGNQLLWGYQEAMDQGLQDTFDLAISKGINLLTQQILTELGDLMGKVKSFSVDLLKKVRKHVPSITSDNIEQADKLVMSMSMCKYSGPKAGRRNIVIATKFAAYPWRLTAAQFTDACKSSLERLQIEQIGIGQLHWSTANYAPFQELALWDGLVAMYEKGLVRAVGVSNYGPKQLLKIHDYLKARGVPLCSAQVQFSLLSMGDSQMELKDICDSLGVRVISYSPLGLGMLTGKYTASKLPAGPRAFLFSQILPGLKPLLSALEEIAQKRGKTIPQVAINWCICKGTIPIPGVKSVSQAEDNLGALGWRLSTDDIFQLETAAQESPRKMIQNIFQTR